MKVKFLSIIFLVTLILSVTPVFAVKPSNNLAGAQEVAWYLSAEVMPVPPYGIMDIPGSDEASKLIMNQPNGAVEVALTGVMKGLNPDTMYTVYLSKSYTPYVYTGWSVEGTYVLRLHYGTKTYDHDIIIDAQSDGTFTGTGGYPAGGPPYIYPYNEVITGTIDVMTGDITLHSDYESSYYYDATGTIAADGTMSGTWQGSGQPVYAWESISGHATKTHTGNTGWPGLFTSTVQPFTFTTDEYGSGSWHLNLRDSDFNDVADTYILSVWINEAGKTMLISDNFDVVVE
jgi:hypothetical protein